MATATWNPYGVKLTLTATAGTVTRTSATKYTVVINASWKVYWSGNKTNYGMSATSGGVTKTISAFGTNHSSGSTSFTGTYSISGYGSQTKSITVNFKNFNSDTGAASTKSLTLSVTVPALASYTVSYNANNGTGAPSAQTKYKGVTLELRAGKPTRTGYTFSKWNTASGGTGTSYSPGGSYTANAAATLYAQWTANKYTISFNANEGSGAPSSITKTYGSAVTLPTKIPTRTNYEFLGWAESSTATSAAYAAGASYSKAITTNTTLYAVWKLAYYRPTITNVSVNRCDSTGKNDDFGTYYNIGFEWNCCQLLGSNPVKSIVVGYKLKSATDYTNLVTLTANGTTTGTQSHILGGSLSPDENYDIRIKVTDSSTQNPNYGEAIKSIATSKYVIDFLKGGNGVSIGKAAENEGFEVAMPSKFNDEITMANFKRLYWLNNAGAKRSMVVLNNENDYFFGYDSYNNSEGTTYFDGNNVMVRSKNGVEFSANDTTGRIESNIPFRTFARCETCSTEVSTLSTSAKIAKCETLQYNTSLGYLTNNNGAIVCNRAGVVLVMAQAYFQGLTAGDTVACQVWKNGATVGGGRASAGGTTVSAAYPPRIMSVSAGDYFDIRVLNATAARGKVAAGSATSLTIMYVV